jgi:RimJ/RimL family protein N-acetyltransferase
MIGPEPSATIIRVAPLPLPDPPLRDATVALRPWTAADLPALLAGAADPVVHRFRYSLPDDAAGARAWLARLREERERGRRLELAINAADDPVALGSVSVQRLYSRDRTPTISYWLGSAGRGRGLGTAAVRLLIGWAFAEMDLTRVQIDTEIDNAASIRLASRCGFTLEGRTHSEQRRRDGAPAEIFVYALPRRSVDGAAAPTDPNG